MKESFSLLLLLVLPLILSSRQDEPAERQYILDAARSAAQEHKILAIEFWAPECSPCMRLKRDIFENSANREFLERHFKAMNLSPADSLYDPLWKYFHLEYQSTVVYLNGDGNEIDRTVSYEGERELYLNIMKDVAEGKHYYSDVMAAYRRDSISVRNVYQMANKLWFRYETDEAVRLYGNVLRLDPEDSCGFGVESRFRIASTQFLQMKDPEKLHKFISDPVKNYYTPQAYIYLIIDLRDRKDTVGCLALCRESLERCPESSDILNRYAWMIYTFKKEKLYPKALDLVQQAISINPTFANYYDTQAWIYYGLGEKEKAIQSMKKAYELRPLQAYLDFIKKVSNE